VFSFSSSTTRAGRVVRFGPGSETDIVLPAVQYPRGYAVSVQGASAISSAGASILRVVSRAHAVTVTVTPSPPHRKGPHQQAL
jgi:endoglycosylceramidase